MSARGDRRSNWRLRHWIGIAAIVALVAGCGGDSDDAGGDSEGAAKAVLAEPTKISVGAAPVFDTTLPLVAKELGYFEDVGIDLTQFRNSGGDLPAQIPVLTNGSLTMVTQVPETSIPAAENFPGITWGYVNDMWFGAAFMQREGGPFKTFEELESADTAAEPEDVLRRTLEQFRGKSLITNYQQEEQFLVNLFNAVGISEAPDEFMNVQSLPAPQGVVAFLRGEGDLFVGSLPDRSRIEEEGGVPITTARQWPAVAGTAVYVGWLIRREWLEENRDAYLRFFSALFRVAEDLSPRTMEPNETQDRALEIMLEWVNEESGASFTIEDARRVNREISPWFTVEEMGAILFDEGSPRNWGQYLSDTEQFLVGAGQLKSGAVDIESHSEAEALYREYLDLRDAAERDLAALEESGDAKALADQARAHFEILNYVDAAALAAQARTQAGG
ncbi:MAG: ABC transporter substrate-binding protein [Acidimicrobiia bacterium]